MKTSCSDESDFIITGLQRPQLFLRVSYCMVRCMWGHPHCRLKIACQRSFSFLLSPITCAIKSSLEATIFFFLSPSFSSSFIIFRSFQSSSFMQEMPAHCLRHPSPTASPVPIWLAVYERLVIERRNGCLFRLVKACNQSIDHLANSLIWLKQWHQVTWASLSRERPSTFCA